MRGYKLRIAYLKANDTWMVTAYKYGTDTSGPEQKYIAGRHSRVELEPVLHDCMGKTWTELNQVKNKYRQRGGRR